MTNRKFQGYQGCESDTTRGLAPLMLVAKRREEATLELPRPALPLPLPLPLRDADYASRPRETEREPSAPTRGVHVFDMV